MFRIALCDDSKQFLEYENPSIFDRDYDSYCSLIEWSEFTNNIGKYINIALQKRDAIYKYNVIKRL